jgi:hypothetical protein
MEEHDLDELLLQHSAQAPRIGADGAARLHGDDVESFARKGLMWCSIGATDDGDRCAFGGQSACRNRERA